MRKIALRVLIVAVLFSALHALPATALTLTGCTGGDFGNDCSLQELLNGGSIETNGITFQSWTLPGNVNDFGATALTSIKVVPLDESLATGLRYFANGSLTFAPTLEVPAGDLKIGFRVNGEIEGATLQIHTPETPSGFAFLFQSLCTSGFDSPSPCPSGNVVSNLQPISDPLFGSTLEETNSFSALSGLFLTLGIQLGGIPGEAPSLDSFEQRFEVFELTDETVPETPRVPEPSSLVLLGSSAGLWLAASWRRRRAAR
jgi:hypothetical protein